MGINHHFEHLLKRHQLKRTEARLRVLNLLVNKKTATSQPDLESVIGDVDRVTLYRILNAFEEKGIIHKVFDLNGTANYAICSSDCDEHHHNDEHLHFNCSNCKNVYCLDELDMPPIALPAGFKLEKLSFSATGLCPKCANKE
ncbi:Fur family transcriptional regulator [Mucilaginibacter sp. UYCu711]|uniref:Fur family transcriptional regulator n=1 Tax=Mucilaginibacter sp. UYCu711 TaxID=3156339 RepID=UPI003D201433